MQESNFENNNVLLSTTFRDLVKVLFRHYIIVILTIVVVMGVVYLGLSLTTPTYTAQVKMLISGEREVQAAYYKNLAHAKPEGMGITQSEIVNSNPVLERVVESLKLYNRPLDYEAKFASSFKARLIEKQYQKTLETLDKMDASFRRTFLFRRAVEDLRNRIRVEPVKDTNLFEINVTDFHPVMAAIIANVISRSYVIFDLEQQRAEMQLKYGDKHPIIRQLIDSINVMNQNLNGEPLVSSVDALGPASVKIIEQAMPPLSSDKSNKRLVLMLALVMSICLGLILAFVFEYLDQSIKSPRDLQILVNVPFLGYIPKKRFAENVLLSNTKSKSTYTRSYHNLCDQIRILLKDKKLNTVLIAASNMKEGVSTAIANMAFYLTNYAHQKVLIIDANLREPSMHNIFKIERTPGLADILEEKAGFADVVKKLSSNLHVLPAGKTSLNPTSLLDSARLSELLKDVRSKYNAVLIDTTNLKNHKDALVISSYVDGMILIASEGKTRRHTIESILMPVRMHAVNLVGSVLNNRTFVVPKFIYDRI